MKKGFFIAHFQFLFLIPGENYCFKKGRCQSIILVDSGQIPAAVTLPPGKIHFNLRK